MHEKKASEGLDNSSPHIASTSSERFEGWHEKRIDRRQLLAAGAAAAVPLFLAACGGGGSGSVGGTGGSLSDLKGKTIGFNQPFLRGADVFIPIEKGVQEEAKKLGVSVLESHAQAQADKQLAEVNAWIAQGVAGITVQAVDPDGAGPMINRAHDAGIPILGYATKLEGEDGYNIFDNAQGADIVSKAAAEYIKKSFGGKAIVGLLEVPTLDVNQERVGATVEKLEGMVPDFEVVANAEAGLAAEALTVTQDMLQANPDINLIVSINDDNLTGARRAFDSAGRDPKSVYMIGFDGSRIAMEQVLDGSITGAIAALPLVDVGRASIALPANIIVGKKPTSMSHDYVLADNEHPENLKKLIGSWTSS